MSFSSSLLRAAAALGLGLSLIPAQAAVATVNTLETGVTVAGFPHKVDVYRPAGATRAIVFLHGHGGRTWQLAYDLGVNRKFLPATAKNVDWTALTRLGVIAVFPQGQVLAPSVLPTWNNHVFDSGQDDVAFLAALSTHVRQAWGAGSVALAGHSSGGTMTARMWCEGTPAYQAYFSIAGPMTSPAYPSHGQTCTPLAPRPYAVTIGDRDTKLAMFAFGIVQPTPEQMAAGLTDTILLSEWARHADRGIAVCGASTTLEGSQPTSAGLAWTACNATLGFTVVPGADHPIASLEQFAGIRMLDWVAGFAAAAR